MDNLEVFMIPQRYKDAEIRRQRILDYLTEVGPRTAVDLAAHLGDQLNTVKSTLRSMVTLKEVEDDGGIRGRMKYSSLVSVTSTAESQYGSTRVESDSSRFAKAHSRNRRSAAREGVTVHRSGDSAIPNQGGQGCVRSYGRRANQDTM